MSFSEKMRDSLGAEGVRLVVTPSPDLKAPGRATTATVMVRGGTRAAHIEALVVRIVEADRYWTDPTGGRVEEAVAAQLDDRRHLTAGWDRRPIHEHRVDLNLDLDEAGEHDVQIEVPIPESCRPTSVSCSHTLNVQADVKGQIDPTSNARIVIAQP